MKVCPACTARFAGDDWHCPSCAWRGATSGSITVVGADREVEGFSGDFFDRLADVFIQHASDEMLDLLPGHAYYLARNEDEFKKRMRYDLLPLLDEYLRQGLLGGMASELHSVRDEIDDYANRP